jgi:CPA2 family monovalent cation:H+ antiporter-2
LEQCSRVSRMLIDPTTLVEYAVPVIILTLVTIFRTIYKLNWCPHIRATTEAVRTNRDEFVTNWEFSLLSLQFEMTMNVTSFFLYPVVVASAVTTSTHRLWSIQQFHFRAIGKSFT